MIGCAAVFRGIAYPATGTAIIPSTAYAWTASRFDRLLRRYPQLAANSLAIVGGRADDMLQRLRDATSKARGPAHCEGTAPLGATRRGRGISGTQRHHRIHCESHDLCVDARRCR